MNEQTKTIQGPYLRVTSLNENFSAMTKLGESMQQLQEASKRLGELFKGAELARKAFTDRTAFIIPKTVLQNHRNNMNALGNIMQQSRILNNLMNKKNTN
jgi:hypothetical protein